MSTAIPPMPEPSPEELERAVADVEDFVASQAPASTADQAPEPDEIAAPVQTRRVRDLRAEVAESHALLGMQADPAPLLVDTDQVRRSRKRAVEAAKLHALAQDPAARAWQAARVRRTLTIVALSALVGALGWSTTGVHHTLTLDVTEYTAAWWGAWAVEPVISAVLLVVVAAKAFLATRGRTLRHRHLTVVEYGALAVTLTLNVWPYLPWQADRFDPMQLLAHAIGPLVAVGAVAVLPIIWSAFADLDHSLSAAPTAQPYSSSTGPEYSGNVLGKVPGAGEATGGSTALLVERARHLIAAGELPADPSATRIREVLGCGTNAAREVRDALRRSAR
ncbi:hypothetical protein JOF53_007080 [Crossiella equi]|uniref:Minus agglutinin n=1 Tax=Crossiella equi TaxID=130796 RepID=A0ABS5ANQ9_9PSEU|nr:hypothetical protein [Crossiella equi]MBP2478208.1 hypothetical protein [Crossiella equi]